MPLKQSHSSDFMSLPSILFLIRYYRDFNNWNFWHICRLIDVNRLLFLDNMLPKIREACKLSLRLWNILLQRPIKLVGTKSKSSTVYMRSFLRYHWCLLIVFLLFVIAWFSSRIAANAVMTQQVWGEQSLYYRPDTDHFYQKYRLNTD